MAAKQVGDRAGPYVLMQVLGEGGAGQVYRASWLPDEEQRSEAPSDHPDEVAVKLLLASHAQSEEIFRRFVREIGVAQQTHHPHLVRHYDSGLADDVLYYAMELVPYGSLREVLQRRGSLPWREAAESARHIADALGALHNAGVVHRDLKPDNVFLSEQGGLKLGDFGLAFKEDGGDLTIGGQTVGSVRYMAPEQVRGLRDLDGRCDLYALGCLLFEMLTGRPPFTSTDPMTVFAQHVEEPPPRLRSIAPTAPESLDRMVASLLEKDKRMRPPTAVAVRDALAAILASESGEIDSLDDYLHGDAVPIEPLPGVEPDEQESLGATEQSAGIALGMELDDDEDEDIESTARNASDLSQRLLRGAPQQTDSVGGKAMLGVALLVLAVILAVIVLRGGADDTQPPSGNDSTSPSPSSGP